MLPNNKNIILAAQQCVDLVEDKKVVVLQAKTVPQGISAMIAMNPDGEEAENTAAMEEAMGQVTTMEITYAARDSSFDGNAIQAGDYLLLVDNQLFGTEKSMKQPGKAGPGEPGARRRVYQHFLRRGRPAGRGGTGPGPR